jgi:hypothetical protein
MRPCSPVGYAGVPPPTEYKASRAKKTAVHIFNCLHLLEEDKEKSEYVVAVFGC